MKVIEDNKIYGGPNNTLSYHRVELLLDSNSDIDNAIYILICAGNLRNENGIINEAKYQNRLERAAELILKLADNKPEASRLSGGDVFPGIGRVYSDRIDDTENYIQQYVCE